MSKVDWHSSKEDFETRPTQERTHPAAAHQYEHPADEVEWPMTDSRIDTIGQNGGDGEHYGSQDLGKSAEGKDEMSIDVLDERQKTYGDFSTLAETVQMMEYCIKVLPGYYKATSGHQEAAHMIIQKLVRAMNGDPHHADTWHDISGYARLAEKECEQ